MNQDQHKAAQDPVRKPPTQAETPTPAQPGKTATSLTEVREHTGPAPDLRRQLPAPFGRYQLLKLLGEGGMGAVYLAHDSQLDRPVALKVPHIRPDDASACERFYREARAAATLHHANICPVHDVGAIDGVTYLTMAFIEGRSLADVLRKNPRALGPRQAAILVRKLALGLEEAHSKHILHRDLKPGNVMLNRRGEPIVMDFGLARRAGQADVRLTQEGALLGTPGYMAPEQVCGKPDDLRPTCDIYALGVILYELLAGRLPFEGELLAILTQKVTDDPPPPSQHRSDVDRVLEAICLKAIARQPADRYASMGEIAAALTDYLKGTVPPSADVTATGLAVPGAAAPTLAVVPPGRAMRSLQGSARRKVPWWMWVVPATVVVGLAVLAVSLLRPSSPGIVRVELKPGDADAQVSVDGQMVSREEAQGGLRLSGGDHVVEVTGAEYATVRKSVTLQGGATEVVSFDLVREPGVVQVQLSDARATVDVKVDGRPVAVAEVSSGLSLPPGEHRLEVTGTAYQPVALSFTVRPKGKDTLVVSLTRRSSSPTPVVKTPTPSPPPAPTPNPPVEPSPQPPPSPGPVVAYAWPAAKLRAGQIPAPDLRGVKPLLHDTFKDSSSGFALYQTGPKGGQWGYESGQYRIQLPHAGVALVRAPVDLESIGKPTGGIACQAVGRSAGRLARWGIVFGPGDRQATWRVWILLGNDGQLHILRGANPVVAREASMSHPAIRRGTNVLNTLLAVLRGRHVEVYVNGVAVCDPILLDEEKPSPRVILACQGVARKATAVAEFHEFTVWPASSISPLEKRGAIPKPK
jgi:hypothetical protein